MDCRVVIDVYSNCWKANPGSFSTPGEGISNLIINQKQYIVAGALLFILKNGIRKRGHHSKWALNCTYNTISNAMRIAMRI